MKTKSPSQDRNSTVTDDVADWVTGGLERINNMKLHIKVLVAVLALAGSAAYLVAQDDGQPPRRRQGNMDGPQQGGQPGGQRPPIPPLMAALDTNHNGVIDAPEIDNAPAALRKLDKNGDGQLTMEELRPPRPQGGRGPGGPGGPGGRGRGPMGPPPNGQDGPPPGDAPQN